jgi:hypothetical protein
MTLRAGVFTTVLVVAFVAMAANRSQAVDPYAGQESDPFAVAVKSTPAADGSFLVELAVTDRATGKVVFAPRVKTRPGIPAELFSEAEDGRVFESYLSVQTDGSVVATFRAYEKLLQRTRVSATGKK